MQDAFRTHGGFIWAITVMNGIGKSIHSTTSDQVEDMIANAGKDVVDTTDSGQQTSIDSESDVDVHPRTQTDPTQTHAAKPASLGEIERSQEAFIFIKTLLSTLSIALTANNENRRYFRTEIRFAALAEALQVREITVELAS